MNGYWSLGYSCNDILRMVKSIATPLSMETDRRPITANEVARLAGVSQSAVSRVFTPGASVSRPTRERVERAARQLGYRPNFVARSMITRRSNIIGVAVPGTANPFYQAALDALSVALAGIGYRVLLFPSDPSAGSDPILEEVLRYRVDALVLVSTSLSSRFADECIRMHLPVVMLNRKTDSPLISSVVGSNREGARTMAAFLLAGKHKRFGYIAGLERSSTSRDRERGFFDFLLANGVKSVQREVGDYTYPGAQAATRLMLSARRPPDAIFCANDYMALTAINVARAEFGLDVGREISIVGFDDIHMAAWPVFGLTTFSQPLAAMVERAVTIIQTQLSNPQTAPIEHVERGELIVRESARKPKSGLSRSGDHWVWRMSK